MICPHCVFIMPDDSRYCPKCGRPTVRVSSKVNMPVSDDKPAKAPPKAATPPSSPLLTVVSADSEARQLQIQLSKANVCKMQGEWEQAIEYCVSVLQADPANHTAHSLLGDIYSGQKKPEDAILWYRMALDIRQNPADAEKLRRCEEELVKRQSSPVANARSKPMMNMNGIAVGGTTQLMGVSPRRWLRQITIASVVFLGVMLVILGVMQMNRRRQPTLPEPSDYTPSTTESGGGSVLPPAAPVGGSRSGNPSPPIETNDGGSGFRPDSSTPAPRSAPPKPSKEVGSFTPLMPAPILTLKPLESGRSNETTLARDSEDPTRLPDGMTIIGVEENALSGVDTIEIEAANASLKAPNPDQKRQILRNAYRTAAMRFEAAPNSKQILCAFYSESERDLPDRKPRCLIGLDRKAVSTIEIEKASQSELEKGLLMMQWGDEAASTASQSASPEVKQPMKKTPPTPAPQLVFEVEPQGKP